MKKCCFFVDAEKPEPGVHFSIFPRHIGPKNVSNPGHDLFPGALKKKHQAE